MRRVRPPSKSYCYRCNCLSKFCKSGVNHCSSLNSLCFITHLEYFILRNKGLSALTLVSSVTNKAPSISSPLGCPSEVEKFEKGKKMSNIFGMEMSQRLGESIFDMKFH